MLTDTQSFHMKPQTDESGKWEGLMNTPGQGRNEDYHRSTPRVGSPPGITDKMSWEN